MEKFHLSSIDQSVQNVPTDANFESGFERVFAPYRPKTVETIEGQTRSNTPSQAKEEAKPAAPPPPAHTEAELLQSRAKGYEEGYAKGFGDARSEAEALNHHIDETLQKLDKTLQDVIEARKFDDVRKSEEVAEIVMQIARKVAGTALAEKPGLEIEKVVKKCFEFLFNEPSIVIYVHSDVMDDVNKRVAAQVQLQGFRGNVEIKAKDALSAGSCHIEWAGGGLKSDKDAIWNEISQLCE